MANWLDNAAKDVAAGRLSRRGLLARGATIAATAVLGESIVESSPASGTAVRSLRRQTVSAGHGLKAMGVQQPQQVAACTGSNNISTVPCDQLQSYLLACGTICPDGSVLTHPGDLTHPGGAVCGCTQSGITFGPNQSTDPKDVVTLGTPRKVRSSSRSTVCWAQPYSMVVQVNPQSTSITWSPDPDVCCKDDCSSKVASRINAECAKHEARHVEIINGSAARFNRRWSGRHEKACGPTDQDARQAAIAVVEAQVEAALVQLNTDITREPTQPMLPDCGPCAAAQGGQVCCNGHCVTACPSGGCPDASGNCSGCPGPIDSQGHCCQTYEILCGGLCTVPCCDGSCPVINTPDNIGKCPCQCLPSPGEFFACGGYPNNPNGTCCVTGFDICCEDAIGGWYCCAAGATCCNSSPPNGYGYCGPPTGCF
jgi:hypothetical protein